MTPEQIHTIALEVAKIDAHDMDQVEDRVDFATRFLATITEKAEPVAKVDRDGHYIRAKFYERGFDLEKGTKLYTHPAIEPAQCQYAKDVAMPEYRCVGECQYDAAATPLQGEVKWMINHLNAIGMTQAADMIERLAKNQVPEECVVVKKYDLTFAAQYMQGAIAKGSDVELVGSRLHKLIAAGRKK